ncbi:MAG: hypothetical protein AAFZ18_15460 [Myxococcota bacterium]
MRIRRGLLMGSLIVSGACTATDGTIEIEGEQAAIEGCRSSRPDGWDGVDILLDRKRALRLFRDSLGSDTVVLVGFFEDPSSNAGILVGDCAVGEIKEQDWFSEGVQHLEGEATLDCIDPLKVSGHVTFAHCH